MCTTMPCIWTVKEFSYTHTCDLYRNTDTQTDRYAQLVKMYVHTITNTPYTSISFSLTAGLQAWHHCHWLVTIKTFSHVTDVPCISTPSHSVMYNTQLKRDFYRRHNYIYIYVYILIVFMHGATWDSSLSVQVTWCTWIIMNMNTVFTVYWRDLISCLPIYHNHDVCISTMNLVKLAITTIFFTFYTLIISSWKGLSGLVGRSFLGKSH